MDEVVGLRDPLAAFAQEMERQLRANDHKLGWEAMSLPTLLVRIRQETEELARAIKQERSYDRIIKESADVANFAMMIADNAAALWEEATLAAGKGE